VYLENAFLDLLIDLRLWTGELNQLAIGFALNQSVYIAVKLTPRELAKHGGAGGSALR
jgi:hypothetical protein